MAPRRPRPTSPKAGRRAMPGRRARTTTSAVSRRGSSPRPRRPPRSPRCCASPRSTTCTSSRAAPAPSSAGVPRRPRVDLRRSTLTPAAPVSSSTRPGDLVVRGPGRDAARRSCRRCSPRPASELALDNAAARRDGRRHRSPISTERPAPAAARHAARPADRHHRRARRRRRRQGRRPGREERRRLRPRQAAHRLLRHPRPDHRGGVPAAPAARRARRSSSAPRRRRRRRRTRRPGRPRLADRAQRGRDRLAGRPAPATRHGPARGDRATASPGAPTRSRGLLGDGGGRPRRPASPALVGPLSVRRRRRRAQAHLRRSAGSATCSTPPGDCGPARRGAARARQRGSAVRARRAAAGDTAADRRVERRRRAAGGRGVARRHVSSSSTRRPSVRDRPSTCGGRCPAST